MFNDQVRSFRKFVWCEQIQNADGQLSNLLATKKKSRCWQTVEHLASKRISYVINDHLEERRLRVEESTHATTSNKTFCKIESDGTIQKHLHTAAELAPWRQPASSKTYSEKRREPAISEWLVRKWAYFKENAKRWWWFVRINWQKKDKPRTFSTRMEYECTI